jgi:hypothetical protein
VRVPLLEQMPMEEIASYFSGHGLSVVVHDEPPSMTDSERRQLRSSTRRRLDREKQPTHWAALVRSDGESVARWYGSGDDEESAVRSAAKRWRIEEVGWDNQRKPGEPLP